MKDNINTKLETYLQHAGMAQFNEDTGAAPVSIPAMRTSTVRFKNLEALDQVETLKNQGHRAVVYGRLGMETHGALEEIFCKLEAGTNACLAPSGMAAITLAMLSFLGNGDHALIADCVYGPVRRLDDSVLKRMGVSTTYCPATIESLSANLKENTKVLYVESPGSLLIEMLDLQKLANFAKENNLILITDNTWGNGFYEPLSLGVDVSVVAGTKYLAGHSDVMLGAIISKDEKIAAQIHETHYALGYAISAEDAWLSIRGARTMMLRLRQSAENGLKVANWLSEHSSIEKVYFPALPSDSGHELWKRDCKGSNGLLSFQLKTDNQGARRFVNALKIFGIGFSWGGFESLVQLVDLNTIKQHSYWNNSDNQVIRIYVGLEDASDLIDDLDQALKYI